VIFEVAHHMALVPLFWLWGRGERRTEWWWLAGIFLVSWLADTVAHWTGAGLVSAVYPLSQAALVAAVFLERRHALAVTGALVLLGLVSVLTHGVATPEVLLHTVAWLSAAGIVAFLPLGRLRVALLVLFAGGWLAYLGYVLAQGWASWLTYQGVRAASIGLFCWAQWKPHPILRLA
jgi:hypothetical protein